MAPSSSTRRSSPTGESITVQDMSVLLLVGLVVGDRGHEGVPEVHAGRRSATVATGRCRRSPSPGRGRARRPRCGPRCRSAGTRRGGRARASRRSRRSTARCRAARASAARTASRSAPRSRATSPAASAAASPVSARPRAAASAATRGRARRARRPREQVGEAGHVGLDRGAVRRDQPAGDRAGAGDADLLADHGADRGLVSVDLAGHPQPAGRPDHAAGSSQSK